MPACEKCLQRLHYIRYLESKIRVLEYRIKLKSILSDSSDTSEDSSSDTSEDIPETEVNNNPNNLRDTVSYSNNRRVIEVPDSTWRNNRRADINKAKKEAKRRRAI